MFISSRLIRQHLFTGRGYLLRTPRPAASCNVRRGLHGLSICHGPQDPALLETTIPEHFASIVSQYGDRPAVVARSPEAATVAPMTTTLTYRSLDETSNSLAHSLRRLGVRKGDRVAISLGNCTEFATLTYAVFKLGAILVPLNPSFNCLQVESALNHLDAKVLIIGAVTDLAYKPTRGRSNLPLLQDLVPNIHGQTSRVQSEKIPNLEHIVLVNNMAAHPAAAVSFPTDFAAVTPFQDLLTGSPSAVVPNEPLAAHEVVNVQFTSGTTSMPKAAMLSHRAILNNGMLIGNRMGLNPGDRIVVPPPLFHCFGSILGYMACATSGSAIMFPSPAFDPVASLRMCVEQNATGLYGVSTMLIAMMDELASGNAVTSVPEGLLKGIVAGSSVPEALMNEVYDKLGMRNLVICYGMTETAPVSCMTAPDDPFQKRTSSVGRVMPHTSVKIVDPTDSSTIVPVGERGELLASGYLVMEGYWGDEEQTARVRTKDSDGTIWMHSGDEAQMDEDGFVYITGRIKDLIIRGGENIHPLEIENCLLQHPDIMDVSVVGLPDEKYGECVAAFIIAKHGVKAPNRESGTGEISDDDVREWVSQRLSSHLVPKHVFWVEEYPKTASGKIQKFKLKEEGKRLCGK